MCKFLMICNRIFSLTGLHLKPIAPSSEMSTARLSPSPSGKIHAGTEEPPADPATAPIKPGAESVIEINKDKMGLGLSIVGGSDTLLVSSILFVYVSIQRDRTCMKITNFYSC